MQPTDEQMRDTPMEDKSVTLKACPVEQVDRDAAASLCERGMANKIRNGNADDHIAVQAFARHRSEAQATGLREAVEAVVEEAKRMTMTMRRRKIFNDLAAALEGAERHG